MYISKSVYIKETPKGLHTILDKSEEFFQTESLSFLVIIPEEFCTPEIQCSLDKRGYIYAESSVCMVLKLDDFEGNKQSNGVRIAHQNDKLDDWMLPLISAFDSTTQVCLPYVERHQGCYKERD
ncbi:MAG: hypothetical protein BGO07_01220 [Alphaproteobacteria bacterium 40-19]|nr:MAG: hypothetical protein BGO07_01220 [Alphaproteobacteria bacterium 40-19]